MSIRVNIKANKKNSSNTYFTEAKTALRFSLHCDFSRSYFFPADHIANLFVEQAAQAGKYLTKQTLELCCNL